MGFRGVVPPIMTHMWQEENPILTALESLASAMLVLLLPNCVASSRRPVPLKFISIYAILCLFDRRYPLWPVYGVPICRLARRSFFDFTSLTLEEFQLLLPPFEAAFRAHMTAWRFDGPPRTARRFRVST